MTQGTLFSDFIEALAVPHTSGYSNRQYETMPFHTLFGLTKLLGKYGVDSCGYKLNDPTEILKISPPFLARTNGGFVIITDITDNKASYITEGENETMAIPEFYDAWDGVVLLAYPNASSCEPGYHSHARTLLLEKMKKWVLAACCIALFAYLFISNGIYSRISLVLLTIIDLCGLYLTYMLVQKSLKISNRHADKVCGVLQAGGCDSILETKASKFFGLFGWSEGGFAYYSVSLLTLLIFPQWTCYLALCNACCLPFTVWSIWYQKFKAKTWCTLCVCVQCTLWLLFFCYLFGGWFKGIFPLKIEFFVLGTTYITALLALNRFTPLFDKSNPTDDNEA